MVNVNFTLAALIFGGYTIYVVNDVLQMMAQKKYEEEFLLKHRHFIAQHFFSGRGRDDHVLRITFPRREAEHLLNLCKQPWSRWTPQHYENLWNLRTFQPSVQTHLLGFRRVALRRIPIMTEVIRCSESYALIEAGDGVSGYVLEKYEPPLDRPTRYTLFYLYAKFQYAQTLADRPLR